MTALKRQQGQLDYFCGLYSIVNAINAAGLSLSKDMERELFYALCHRLEEEGKLLAVLSEGCGRDLISKMLSSTKDWLINHYGKSLAWRKPFHKHTAASPDLVFDIVGACIKGETKSAIIGLGGKIDHWTVLEDVSSNRLYLNDSEGRLFIQRNLCKSHQETSEERFYWVYPSAIFLLELT